MKNQSQYVTFHNGKVYHIACLGVTKHGLDATLCGVLTLSRNGGNQQGSYLGGCPTPQIVAKHPGDFPLCKACAKAKAMGRTKPKWVKR